MSSFSCPHIDEKSFCQLLRIDCLPGRKGCVLKSKVDFILPAEQRLLKQSKQEEDRFALFRRKNKRNKP